MVDTAVDFPLLRGDIRIDATRLACMNDLADDARVVGDAQLAAIDAKSRSPDERVRLFVPEENACSLGIKQLRRCLGEAYEQHVSHHKDCVYDRRSGENLQG